MSARACGCLLLLHGATTPCLNPSLLCLHSCALCHADKGSAMGDGKNAWGLLLMQGLCMLHSCDIDMVVTVLTTTILASHHHIFQHALCHVCLLGCISCWPPLELPSAGPSAACFALACMLLMSQSSLVAGMLRVEDCTLWPSS